MKILSLDLGQKRIGVAVSDGEIVASLDTIETRDRTDALAQILKICRDEQVELIVLGLPRSQSSEAEDMVRSFALELNKIITLPVELIDETLTSKEAERILQNIRVDPKSEKYKKEVDRISAKLILEQYLKK